MAIDNKESEIYVQFMYILRESELSACFRVCISKVCDTSDSPSKLVLLSFTFSSRICICISSSSFSPNHQHLKKKRKLG